MNCRGFVVADMMLTPSGIVFLFLLAFSFFDLNINMSPGFATCAENRNLDKSEAQISKSKFTLSPIHRTAARTGSN